MRFSKRTGWNTEETELSQAYRRRRASGAPLADLTASNPTRCDFMYPSDLLDSLNDPCALAYAPDPRGARRAREAVRGYYAAMGVDLPVENLLLTTSTSEAYSFLFRLLCDPGDEIVVPQPGYPLFDFLAVLDDVQIKPAPLVYDYGWQIDPEGFRRAITPQTRAIVVVHPNNPTGHFTKAWEIEELARLCREFSLSLVVDEVFLNYRHAGKSESFACGIEGVPVFVVSGLSKIAGLPQMKAAWIAATGPESHEAVERLEVISDTFLSMNAPIQSAMPAWIESAGRVQGQILERVKGNLVELERRIAAVKTLTLLKVEGGWYATLRIPAVQPDDCTVLELLERGVWTHPGHFFGMSDAGWLVVSLLGPVDEFARGAALLAQYFAEREQA